MPVLLPLFPLQLVVLPGNAIPLHIFEPCYREMVGEAEASGTEFGIVQATEQGIANCGCTAVVERVVNRYPDGRFDVVTRALRRFLVDFVNQEKAYLRGEITFFDDEPAGIPDELRARVLRALEQLPDEPVDLDAGLLSFQAAGFLDDLEFKSRVQRSRSEAERLRMVADFLEDLRPKRTYAARMKRAAYTNGYGKNH